MDAATISEKAQESGQPMLWRHRRRAEAELERVMPPARMQMMETRWRNSRTAHPSRQLLRVTHAVELFCVIM